MSNRFFTAAAFAAILITSCSKEQAPEVIDEPREKVDLVIKLDGLFRSTKATVPDTADESKVNNLQVFCFRGDVIDGYKSLDSATEVNVTSTTGDHEIYALVNCPDYSAIGTKDGLLEKISELTRKNGSAYVNAAGDNFEMIGSLVKTIAVSDAEKPIEVHVKRIGARFKVGKVTRAFSSSVLSALPADKVKLTRIYLTNVVADSKYSFAGMEHTWLSSPMVKSGAIDKDFPLVYKSLPSDANIANNSSYNADVTMYAYPNPATVDNASSRVTRVVVEMFIDGAYYTYPIFVNNVLPNRSYEIKELIITKKGNPSNGDDVVDPGEDEAISNLDVDFTLVVDDWDLVLLGTDGTVTL